MLSEQVKIFKLFGVSVSAIEEASKQILARTLGKVRVSFEHTDGDFLVKLNITTY